MGKVLISRCLTGAPCRYDGRSKFAPEVLEFLRNCELVTICPEADCGLGAPREPMTLCGDPASPRLLGNATGDDRTDLLLTWLPGALEAIAEAGIDCAVLKARSPSCGLGSAPCGAAVTDGLFAAALKRRFPGLPCHDETTLIKEPPQC